MICAFLPFFFFLECITFSNESNFLCVLDHFPVEMVLLLWGHYEILNSLEKGLDGLTHCSSSLISLTSPLFSPGITFFFFRFHNIGSSGLFPLSNAGF